VSYSHKDQKFLNELKESLVPYQHNEQLLVWSDEDLKPGEEWKKKIATALDQASIAILLASTFIRDHELPRILDNSRIEKTRIFWVLLFPAAVEQAGLGGFQSACPGSKPLAALNKVERAQIWTDLGKRIHTHLGGVVAQSRAMGTPYDEPRESASLLELCPHCRRKGLFIGSVCPSCGADRNLRPGVYSTRRE
jgi:hypothetical protein